MEATLCFSILLQTTRIHARRIIPILKKKGFIHPDDWDTVRQHFRQLLAGKGPSTFSYRCRKKDGCYIWLESTCTAITPPDTDNESAQEIIGSSRDITERKKAEQALQESEQRFRSLFQYHPDAVLFHGFTRAFSYRK